MKNKNKNQHFIYHFLHNNIKELFSVAEEYVRKTIKLNAKLWEEFQEKIEKEYGTTYNHTSEELEKAIENYVNADVLDIEKTKTKINNLNDENRNVRDRLCQLQKDYNGLNDELLENKTNSKKDQDKIRDLEKKLNSIEYEKDICDNRINALEKENEMLNKENSSILSENEKLKSENERLEDKYIEQVEETNKQVKENTKIKNKREHTQERLNKTQDELNDTLKRLEKYGFAIGQVKNMSFIDRVLNRLPEEIKELQPGKEENEE